jgi:hypothetical protein
MGLVASFVSFAVSLLVGGFAIYVGGRLVTDTDSYEHALWTAAIGAVVWALVSGLLDDLPELGPVLTLVAWVAVVRWRYPGGWVRAAAIGALAWGAAVGTVWVLAQAGVTGLGATGVPGV